MICCSIILGILPTASFKNLLENHKGDNYMSGTLTIQNSTQEILKYCTDYKSKDPTSFNECCGIAKSLFNCASFDNKGAPITDKVCSTFQIALNHVQKTVQEVATNQNSYIDKNLAQIGIGVVFAGFGVYEGYQCVKNFFNGNKIKASFHGGVSVGTVLTGGYLIYNGIYNISLSPFCEK